MKIMNDNMIVQIAMVWVLFISVWVASTGFIKRGSACWVMEFLSIGIPNWKLFIYHSGPAELGVLGVL